MMMTDELTAVAIKSKLRSERMNYFSSGGNIGLAWL